MITSKEQVPGEQAMFRKKEVSGKGKEVNFEDIKKSLRESREKKIIK